MKKFLIITTLLLTACDGISLPRVPSWLKINPYKNMTREELISASKNGDIEATYLVGNSFCCGNENGKNNELAYRYICRAAKEGHVNAQVRMGNFYEKGLPFSSGGIEKNKIKAYMWYNVAADLKNSVASDLKENMADDMTLDEINKSFELRRNWQSSVCEVE